MLEMHGVPIDDTFAEAFPMSGARLIITGEEEQWAQIAATEFCGNASSVIGCDTEAAIEEGRREIAAPDGRDGVSVLAFAFDSKSLAHAVSSRVGQNVLTCPTTACYDGLEEALAEQRIMVGGALRFFGDGWQVSKKLDGRRYWRVPVMDGEFVCEDRFGVVKGVGGGNLLLGGANPHHALMAARSAVEAIRQVAGCIMPFPGGIVRAGSKVGSKYKALRASTNDAHCPTLRAQAETDLPDNCQCVYELVIDGLTFEIVQRAMRAGLHAACRAGGLVYISAGNYGGQLGKHHFHLRDLL
jgi:formylmethanofuran--tetrahydromethanopterin N-formyltransferase